MAKNKRERVRCYVSYDIDKHTSISRVDSALTKIVTLLGGVIDGSGAGFGQRDLDVEINKKNIPALRNEVRKIGAKVHE